MRRRRAHLRPKVRRQRRSAAGVAAVLGLAVFAAAAGIRAKPWRQWSVPSFGVVLPEAARVERMEFAGAPGPVEEEARRIVSWQPGDRWGPFRPYRAAGSIVEALDCLAAVRVDRSLAERRVSFALELKKPAAAIYSGGELTGFLSETGAVFSAPPGSYDAAELPAADLGRPAVETDFKRLAALLRSARTSEALNGRAARWSYSRAEHGWVGSLDDGTRLLWGDLRWTEEKLRRLKEVLADADGRFGPGLTADLRHFEDGKILVRRK